MLSRSFFIAFLFVVAFVGAMLDDGETKIGPRFQAARLLRGAAPQEVNAPPGQSGNQEFDRTEQGSDKHT